MLHNKHAHTRFIQECETVNGSPHYNYLTKNYVSTCLSCRDMYFCLKNEHHRKQSTKQNKLVKKQTSQWSKWSWVMWLGSRSCWTSFGIDVHPALDQGLAKAVNSHRTHLVRHVVFCVAGHQFFCVPAICRCKWLISTRRGVRCGPRREGRGIMHIRCIEDEVPRFGVRVLHGSTGVSTHYGDRRKSYSGDLVQLALDWEAEVVKV